METNDWNVDAIGKEKMEKYREDMDDNRKKRKKWRNTGKIKYKKWYKMREKDRKFNGETKRIRKPN